MDNNASNDRNRQVYLDYLRILATFATMMIHVVASSITKGYSEEYRIANVYSSAVRWCVPVFVMISGAIFLNRTNCRRKIYNHVVRMFIAFIVWSFIYYLFSGVIIDQIKKLFIPNAKNFLISIFQGYGHLWFIPMISGIYICIPILKKIAEEERILDYFLALSFVFWILLPQIWQMLCDFGSDDLRGTVEIIYNDIYNMNMSLRFCGGYVFYFLLGYKLTKIKLKKKYRLLVYCMGTAGYLFTIFANLFVAIKTQSAIVTYYAYETVNVMLESIAIFILFQNCSFEDGKWYRIVVVRVAKWSFGAYLVHCLVINALRKNGIYLLSLYPVVAPIADTGLVFVSSFIISAFLNNIPFVKKTV